MPDGGNESVIMFRYLRVNVLGPESRFCSGCRHRSTQNAGSIPDIHPSGLTVSNVASISTITTLVFNQYRVLTCVSLREVENIVVRRPMKLSPTSCQIRISDDDHVKKQFA